MEKQTKQCYYYDCWGDIFMNNNIVNKKRIEWIDILRGIGIIYVVLGHCTGNLILSDYISSFHMQLFFLMSGYLFTIEKYDNFKDFMISKFKSLLVPYIIFATIGVLFQYIFYKINHGTFNIHEIIIGIITGKNIWDFPLWFLLSLFVDCIVFYVLIKHISNLKYIVLIATIISLLGYISPVYINNLWRTKSTIVSIFFLGIGYIVRRKFDLDKLKHTKILMLILISLGIIISIYSNNQVIVSRAQFGNYIIFIVCAIVSISGYLLLSMNLINTKIGDIFKYLGYNSIIILSTHYYILSIINFINEIYNLNMDRILVAVIVLILEIPVIYVINKYLAFMIGKNIRKKVI